MKSWSSFVGLACGMLGLTAGAYFGITGAMSQSDPARVGPSLDLVGAIVGLSCSVMGIASGYYLSRRNR